MTRSLVLLVALLFPMASPAADPPKTKSNPVVPDLKKEIQKLIDADLKDAQTDTLAELKKPENIEANFKLPLCVKGLPDPWGGMIDLEKHALDLSDAAQKAQPLAPLLDQMSAALGKPAGKPTTIAFDKKTPPLDHALKVLDEAGKLFDEATVKMPARERKILFNWTAPLVNHFGPQATFNEKTRPTLHNDRALCAFVWKDYDWPKFVGSAQTLTTLFDPTFLDALDKSFADAKPLTDKIPGVTGDVMYHKETPHGLILVGGKGKNTYQLKDPVALLIDLGGDDEYSGVIASPADETHPLSVVIDLDGNDKYSSEELGLATGRIGIGLLYDRAGKDTYKLAQGSGGTGFGGIGILWDASGDDIYEGSKFTQGAAIAGMGLLLDSAGKDEYTSHGYAIGLGGPAAFGAVIDLDGNDRYQCGKKYGSGYNSSDAPNAKPGDDDYQYDAWGIGMGLGRRLFPFNKDAMEYSLAGGLGAVIDLAGNDRYELSNFSQACGYFFGVGLKVDHAGDDEHLGARYSHASGAHYGMGLHLDYAGKDRYGSTGPTYNCGCAWDHSVFLCIDAGTGDDTYDFKRSAGLARADIGSWSVFADLGGKDKYIAPGGLGRVSQKSLSVFYDAAGDDDYSAVAKQEDFQAANGAQKADKQGGLFVDRATK